MSPQELAQGQLDAYNAHDLDAFLAFFSEDFTLYDFPDSERLRGKALIRERYAQILFAGSTVHATVTQRMVHGNVVIDHEFVTGHPLVGDTSLIVIYEVRDGLISAMRAIR
ncbi:nuclear transport factor 2 family protein [Chitinimonas sp.]|uniref:nuclear transport factor 2 family protein n=1 Tax=Chitinimonas sp. TaxID=1934313 RepID=UPI0035B3DEB6